MREAMDEAATLKEEGNELFQAMCPGNTPRRR